MTQPDFIVIPTQLLTDEALQPSDRILFGYIYWMTKLALMKCVASNKTLAELTGISERGIQLSLVRLEQQGYVRRIFVGDGSSHREEIICLLAFSASKQKPARTNVRPSTNKRSPTARTNVRHNKKIEKEKLIRKIETNVSIGANAPSQYGKPEINELFSFWEQSVGYPIASRREANRRACSNLIKSQGADKVRALVRGVALAQNDKYAPRIADFCGLQADMNRLLAWGKSRGISNGSRNID